MHRVAIADPEVQVPQSRRMRRGAHPDPRARAHVGQRVDRRVDHCGIELHADDLGAVAEVVEQSPEIERLALHAGRLRVRFCHGSLPSA